MRILSLFLKTATVGTDAAYSQGAAHLGRNFLRFLLFERHTCPVGAESCDSVVQTVRAEMIVLAPNGHAILKPDIFKAFAICPDFGKVRLFKHVRQVGLPACAIVEAHPDFVAVKYLYVDDFHELYVCRLKSAEHAVSLHQAAALDLTLAEGVLYCYN